MKTCPVCNAEFTRHPPARLAAMKTCSKQCGQKVRHGNKTPDQRFDERYTINSETGCWEWTAGTNRQGYGNMSVGGVVQTSYRYSYERFIGPVPAGLCVCHKCDNPSCVNPEHLFVSTQAENMKDMVAKGRSLKGSKHSMAKLTEDNVRMIRRFLSRGRLTKTHIAKMFSVDRTTIGAIANGKNWAWLK